MKSIVIFLMCMLLLSACDNTKRYVYVNPETEVCGILQPVHNIDWLREIDVNLANRVYNTDNNQYYDIVIAAYEDVNTGENYVVSFCNTTYTKVVVRSCDGSIVMQGEWENPHSDFIDEMHKDDVDENVEPCLQCDEFFSNLKFVDILSRYEYKHK